MPLQEVTAEKIIAAGQVRYVVPILIAKVAGSYMASGPDSSITFTTGAVSKNLSLGRTVVAGYAVAMHGLVKSLVLEMKHVRINAVAPGAVDTALWRMGAEEKQGLFQGVREENLSRRVAGPEDVAQAYLWLIRDLNATGTVARSDPGSTFVLGGVWGTVG